jgi:hypothetical protein
MPRWPEDRRLGTKAWSHDHYGRREDPDEFPGPVRRISEGRRGYGQAGQDDRFGRSGVEAGYYGRYAGRAEGGLANYRGRSGAVPGGRYGAYADTYDDASGHGHYGGQYEGLSPGEAGGNAKGKGPKGYVRSDDRILEDVCERLTDDCLLDASDIEVKVEGGEVTLSGTVSHRIYKHHAEDLADQTAGVRHVQNNLRIRQRAQADRTIGS